jgi:hypothetical protein
MPRKITPKPFGHRPGKEPYNASEVVALGDSRFLFCDNNVPDALFEFRLAPSGALRGCLVRRPIEGLEPGAIDDIEGIEIVEIERHRFIFGTSSLCLKARKGHHRKKRKRGKAVASRESIIRIVIGRDGRLRAEVIPDFRPWIVAQSPWLQRAAQHLPDDGGLNVEALSWDPREKALLFGLRTPALDGRPTLIRVKPKRPAGPWELKNLEVLSPLSLAVPDQKEEVGIRAMSLDQSTGVSLIILGNATSSSKARFGLYSWDGNARGVLRHYPDVTFHKRMKVEGVTRGTIHGRRAVVFVDDGGGFRALWNDDRLLARAVEL